MALREAWAVHEQTKSALRGMLHTPIYLAMTIATQIGVCNRSLDLKKLCFNVNIRLLKYYIRGSVNTECFNLLTTSLIEPSP